MKPIVVCCAVLAAAISSSCTATRQAPPAVTLPLNVGNGVGSQNGTYAAQSDGEMLGSSGERCIIYNWDRPLAPGLALRLRSASCASAERPGQFVAREISRTVIPIAESNLQDEASQ